MHSIGRIFIVAAMVLASGCRIDTNQPQAATSQAESAAVATTASVSVTSDGVLTDSLSGEAAIADNFDGTPGIGPVDGPAITAGDGAAAFRMFCSAGQLAKDDPLVYPGQSGVSHLHQFMGNTGTNANSNYQSLRTSGNTSCGNATTPFNRSAYWFPAMLDGVGHVVKPDFMGLYYKRNSASDPMCSLSSPEHLGQCVDLPNGIRWVLGYNMKTMTPGEPGSVHFACWDAEDGSVSRGPATGDYSSIAQVAAAGCPVGAQLMILANSPNCWDGVHLDSADHRSHMSYATGPYYQGQLFRACPIDHPYMIPDMEVLIRFTVDENLAKWRLTSDEMVAGAANGSTFHLDYWEAWSPTVKQMWHAGCINMHLSCSNGGLDDKVQIKNAGIPWGGFPKHQLVALSTIPGATGSTTSTPTTQVCPDGSVIPLTQACPVPAPSPVPAPKNSGKALGRKK